MIQGLGADKTGWILQRCAFAPHFRTIALDNRGSGRSDKPFGHYHLDQMADDAVAVLDAAGIESAHVMGASMGGAIAQIVALRHPERVRSLVLSCTACRHHDWRRELLAEWASIATERGMAALARHAMRWLVGPRSFRRFWPALGTLGPLALRVPPYAFSAQVRAILDTDDALRLALPTLHVPTLVVVGNQDILTPRGDSEELAELIPGAELAVISGAAHGLMLEHATTFNRIVLDFLQRTSVELAAA
jgi:3-oxoadipate enol-lactonase